MASKHLMIALAATTVALQSCGYNSVRDVPNHIQPGNAITVSQAVTGHGQARDDVTMGSVGNPEWLSPNVPIMVAGTMDVLYAYPRASLDGEALRDGHFVYVKVHEQSFRKAHHRREKNLLNALDQDLMERESTMPRSMELNTGNSGRNSGPVGSLLPRIAGGESQTSVTIVEAQEDGSVKPVGKGQVPYSSDPKATYESAYDMAEAYNRQVKAMREQTEASE